MTMCERFTHDPAGPGTYVGELEDGSTVGAAELDGSGALEVSDGSLVDGSTVGELEDGSVVGSAGAEDVGSAVAELEDGSTVGALELGAGVVSHVGSSFSPVCCPVCSAHGGLVTVGSLA